MSMLSRRTARSALPPLLALGLVAVAVHPIDSPEALPGPRSAAAVAPAASPGSPSAGAAGVGVSVPVVAFTEHVDVTAGRLRTPIIVNESGSTGVASVVGLAGCSVPAKAGVVAWLDCAYPARDGELTVQVALAGGVVYTHTVLPTRD
jgi:hypothetical protein